jgi:TfoX/Sxy family transcriptional regulator of competence genes
MASGLTTVHYICDQAGLGPRLTFKKMFGEFGLYVDGKLVALVCDDQLYLKPSAEGQACLGTVSLVPPYPGARDYFLLASEVDDPERLRSALEVTAREMPMPKPKPKQVSTGARRKLAKH